jgi:hypothetical protein
VHTVAPRAYWVPEPTIFAQFLGRGGQGRNRTSDTVIFSHVLYQLSYLAPQERLPKDVQKPEYNMRNSHLGQPTAQ